MSKLKDGQVKQYQYGSQKEVTEVLGFCAQNPSWPRSSDKETIEGMIVAAGMKTRRFIGDKDGDLANPAIIDNTFKYVWIPIAEYEPSYLTYGTIDEFKTEDFQESSKREDINQVIFLVDNAARVKKMQNIQASFANNPNFQMATPHQPLGEGQVQRGNRNQQQGGGGDPNGFSQNDPGGSQGGGAQSKYAQALANDTGGGGVTLKMTRPAGGGKKSGTNRGGAFTRTDNGDTGFDIQDEDIDAYEHEHQRCSCKHCNRGNKIRCHLCGQILSEKEIEDVEKNRKRDDDRASKSNQAEQRKQQKEKKKK